jgi:hypothetical protein
MSSAAELHALRERAKELRCLYRVGEALSRRADPPHQVFRGVLEAMPEGWQHPDQTRARISYLGRTYASPGFAESKWQLRAPLRVWQTEVGSIEVVYAPEAGFDVDPFLTEERQLLETIAKRLGEYLEWKHQELVGERIGASRGEEHWRWRQRFAERLAARIEPERWGVERVYLAGSTEEGTAGPGSDIDLVIVFRGTEEQRTGLQQWLEGWSLCLAEVAHDHTGYTFDRGALDVRFVDELPTSHAASTPLRELRLARPAAVVG